MNSNLSGPGRTLLAVCALLLLLLCAHAQAPTVLEVRVTGNDFISKDAILSVVKTKVGQPLSEETLAADREAILRLKYFTDVQVNTQVEPEGVRVIFQVIEKPRITQITFIGVHVVDEKALKDAMLSKEGQLADSDRIARDARQIEQYYASQGYLATVTSAEVDDFGVLRIVVQEARIERIEINGLHKTKESVVRRVMQTKPGDIFNIHSLQKDLNEIANLGIFDLTPPNEPKIGNITPSETEGFKSVVVPIELKERKTGLATMGIGYSSLDKFVGYISVSETNMRGAAERATLELQFGGATRYELGWADPWIDRKNTSLEVNLYDSERHRRFGLGSPLGNIADRSRLFSERRRGISMTLGRPIGGLRRKVFLSFRSESVSSATYQAIRDIGIPTIPIARQETVPGGSADGLPAAETFTQPDAGTSPPGGQPGPIIVTSPLHPGGSVTVLGVRGVDDQRDVIVNPTRGHYVSLGIEQALEPLGSSLNYLKVTGEYRRYTSLDDKTVLAGRIEVGFSSGSLPVYESFIVGGADTLRGYSEDRFYGKRMFLANIEYRRFIDRKRTLMGVLFADYGDAWGGVFPSLVPGLTIRAEHQDYKPSLGVGFGVRVDTPIGPLRFDQGFGKDGSRSHFSVGHVF